jgi:small-conductance mechanosensitive channel
MNNISSCSAVNQAIWTAFKTHDIEIPYPQQVAYLARSSAAAATDRQSRRLGEGETGQPG